MSLLRYSPALVLFAIVVCDSVRIADADLWGHIRFGQAILAQGHAPLVNTYSYSAPGYKFVDLEWLSDAALGLAYSALGIIGLKLLKFLCTAATITLLALAMGETGAPTTVQFAVLLACALPLSWQMEFRPQLFTFAFLSGLLVVLGREMRGRRMALWLLVPMFTVWTNFHGGFFMGLVALGVFSTVVCAEDFFAGRGLGRAPRLFGVTAASALATLITPYGLGTWRGVVRAVRNPYSYKILVEWRPLIPTIARQWSAGSWGLVYIAVALVLFVALAVSLYLAPATDDLPLVAFAAVAIVAAFMAARNLAIAEIALAAPLTRHLGLAVTDWRARKGLPAEPALGPSSLANQLIVGAIAVAFAIETGLFSSRLPTDIRYPAGAVRFMKTHRLKGKILNRYAWGDYLIWHLEPGSLVFIDGREDFAYPVRLVGDYMRFYSALPGGAQVLTKYPPDFVLISPTMPAFKMMESRAGWKLVYRDGDSALFARTDSAAARIPGVPVLVTAKTRVQYFP